MKKLNLDKNLILSLHNKGLTDKEIADQLGCERSNITYHLNKMGVTNRKSKIENIELRNKISESLIGRYVGSNNHNFKGYTDEKLSQEASLKHFQKEK